MDVGTGGRTRSGTAVVVLAIVLGLGLRVWEAFESSLWLDELHSLAHASPDSVAGVFEHVHWDFHVPLFFTALHFLRGVTCPESLRFVPIVASLLVLVPLLAFARRSRFGPGAAGLAALLFATLPYQIEYATELRPYAWLLLASAAACWAAFTGDASTPVRFAVFAAAVAFGVWTHHVMAVAVIFIGLVRVLFLLPPLKSMRMTGGKPLALGWLILAGALGAAALAPWVFKYMWWAVEDPSELQRPDADQQAVTALHVADIAEAPLKTLVPRLASLGSPWTEVATAGAVVLAGVIAVAGAAWFLRAVRGDLPAVDRANALATTFLLLSLVLLGVSIWSWGRVSIRYLCISAWLWPVLICELLAAVRSPRIRNAMAALAVLGASAAGIAHAAGTTREDVRGAVKAAKAAAAELVAAGGPPPYFTAFLSQPPRFEHCTPYLAYARDVPCVELKDPAHAGPKPPLLPRKGDPGFERPVVVITRRWLDLDQPARLAAARREKNQEIPRLLEGRRVLRKVPLDETMTVWVFGPDKP